MPDGRSMTGFAHEYKRHGTTNLFAALNVATGQVRAQCFPRKRREEFLQFLDSVTACHPRKEIHIILDNLSVHKLKPDHPWIKRHPTVRFHFTPTHASWLNQIEVWFSILSRAALKEKSRGLFLIEHPQSPMFARGVIRVSGAKQKPHGA